MKRSILVLAIAFICLSGIQAQTKMKWNVLYWAVGVANVSVETRLSNHWTLNGDLVYSPWESLGGNPMKFSQTLVEGRYYPRGAFNGFYGGVYGAYHHLFKFTKWNYINKDHYQRGNGMSFGATLGYQLEINSRWGMDVYVGYGWQHTTYKGYLKSSGERYVDTNGSGEWLPYKLGAAFVYRL